MARPRGAGAQTEARVRDAAVRLFARQGFAATGLRELATEAGLTAASLYHYMSSKEDLLVEIMRSTTEPLLDSAFALPADRPPEWRLAALVEAHVWTHGARPMACLVSDTELRALHHEHLTEIVALRDAYEHQWRAVVAEGAANGRFVVTDVQVASSGLLQFATGVVHWYSPVGRLSLSRLCSTHADLALGMIRAHVGDRPVRRSDLDLPAPDARLPVTAIERTLHG
ncbi:MAG: TetR/AcrR family transcriptional regulator [Pseudonocardiales bacterium]|nr:TetR/AcrR family transcriptional regulator [Pseudonocardiales bacterium]